MPTLNRSSLSAPARRWALCLAVFVPLLSGCEFFDDVVVPELDDGPPIAWAFLLEDGGYIPANGRTFETRDPDESFIILSAAYDQGGARRVTMRRTTEARYESFGWSGGWALNTGIYAPDTHEVPDACPGDVVSNGLWTGAFVTPGHDWPEHCGDLKLVSVTYTWTVEAEDMHGNVTLAPGGTIIYRP